MLLYTIFRTKWGYFGLAGTEEAIVRACLPILPREQAEEKLLQSLYLSGDNHLPDKDLQHDLQERIIAYYEGEPVDFRTDPAVSLSATGPFALKVLHACRTIAFGQTTTYSELAKRVDSPNAARAVGSVMASNPIPLIIPCHRVLRTDGGLGGFSAPGGTSTKQKMLDHEQAAAARLKRRVRRAKGSAPDAVQEAIDYGIDVAAIRDNLALTPTERLHRHQIALNAAEMLQKARRP
jgi:methylated-DNA-[protein]-cysteine S-methyltransferase